VKPVGPFLRPRRIDAPALRLVIFHHAGGSAAGYHGLARELPPDWDVLLLDLPGRGRRTSEPLLEDIGPLINGAVRDVRAWTDVPYALFGHSLGAIVASEVGRELGAHGTPPRWVGVSGRAAPGEFGLPGRSGAHRALSQLDDEGLLTELTPLGGIPQQLVDEPEILARFVRTVRADMVAVDSYQPNPDRPPLLCPLTAFGGLSDAWVPPAALEGWSGETLGSFRLRLFPGGHFYFLGARLRSFAKDLVDDVQGAVGQVDQPRGGLVPEPVG
jgi:surfactin synthase thioesterase subunit